MLIDECFSGERNLADRDEVLTSGWSSVELAAIGTLTPTLNATDWVPMSADTVSDGLSDAPSAVPSAAPTTRSETTPTVPAFALPTASSEAMGGAGQGGSTDLYYAFAVVTPVLFCY
jgi:hypothetical protein